VVVPGLLHEHEDLLQRRVGLQALGQGTKAFPGVGEDQRRAALEAPMPLQQGGRNKASDVLVLANVNAHVERLVSQQGHGAQPGDSGARAGAGHETPSPVRPTASAPTFHPAPLPAGVPQFARCVPSMAAFSLFFGCQKREEAWQRAKRCAACRPGCLRRPGRGERNCIAKPALPALDSPLSPALGVGGLRRCAWRLGREQHRLASAVDGRSVVG
jgi:hypothetical protein